jgi:RND family efflux transporter MFP subunit
MTVFAETEGRIEGVYADVGDVMDESGVFARIDTTFIELDLEKNHARQKQSLSEMKYLDNEVKRHRVLSKKELVSASLLERLEKDLESSKNLIKTLKAEEETLRERLKRTAIKAPTGWTVIKRLVEPGEWTGPGKPVALLGDFRSLKVPYALRAEEVQHLEASKNPIILFLPERGIEVPAEIRWISPAFDPVTRKIDIEMEIPGPFEDMRGGLRAELSINIPDPSGAVLVPAQAVSERFEEHWLQRENGREVQVVVLGRVDPGHLKVMSEKIKPGDRFIKP